MQQFPLSAEDRALVDRIEAELHAAGWADHTDLDRELSVWARLAEEVNDYDCIQEEFTNDLDSRRWLARFLDRCPEPLRSRVAGRVETIDRQFRAETRQDRDGSLMSAYDDDPWWMSRVPLRGPLLDELEQLRDSRRRESAKWERFARDDR